MRVVSLIKNNGLASLTAEENLEGVKLKYTVSQVYNPDTLEIDLDFTSYDWTVKEVPKDIKEKLTKMLAVMLAEY